MEWNQAATSRDQRIDYNIRILLSTQCLLPNCHEGDRHRSGSPLFHPSTAPSFHLAPFDALASCPTLDLPPHDPLDPVHPVSRSPHPFRQVRSSTSELPLPHLDHPSPPCSSSRHSSSSCQEGTISRSSRLSWVRMGKFSRESPSWIWRGRRWRSIKGGFMGLGIGQR